MNVSINGRFLGQAVTGVQRFGLEVLRALDTLLLEGHPLTAGLQVTILTPPATATPPFERITVKPVGRLRGHAWEQLELPLYARGTLLVSLANSAPVAAWGQIVTFHDAGPFALPESYSFAFRSFYRSLFLSASRSARTVLTVSEFSRRELARYLRLPEGRITVLPEGHEHIERLCADRGILERFSLQTQPYLLAVSSRAPHKNFGAVSRALEHLENRDFRVVIAGGSHDKVFKDAPAAVAGVTQVGYVSDEELKALYEGAAAFIHPSYYEGFGLTPLEAMRCGCPVIAARASSLPEVCGEAVLYCDPHDPADIAAQIRRLMHGPALRAQLSAAGRERSERFRWRNAAEGLLKIITQEGHERP